MTAMTFDTLKFANRLKAAGMEPRLAEEQAEAMSEALEGNREDLATKQDIKDLRQELVMLEQRMTIKLGALMVAAVGIVATLVKLL